MRDPFSLQPWLAYTAHLLAEGKPGALLCVYERAVAALPGSYKLWRAYAHAFRAHARSFHPAHPARTAALAVSLRAARALRVSPVLWAELVRHAAAERRWTQARTAVNDALRALPVLQHDMLWDAVLEDIVSAEGVPGRLEVLLLRRYAKLRPGNGRERLYRCLRRARMWDEAVSELIAALADPEWKPEGEFTREQLWMELARLAAKHPRQVVSTDVPTLLRGGIKGAKTDVGELWVVFGEYFIRKGLFEDARNVYEEAVTTVTAVRDFAVVFDAYAKFEESLASAAIEDVETIKEEIKEEGGDESTNAELKEANEMVDLLIARLEFLTDRRPMLLSDVWLRQNPHNVHEWHKRARMFKQTKDAANVVDTYTKAVQTVNPWRATNGRPHTLWLAFARYYEDAKDLASARQVLDKAVSDPDGFRSAEDLAAVWCEYAEMELRSNAPEAARDVLIRATKKPEKTEKEEDARRRGEAVSNMQAVVGAGGGNTMISHAYDTSSPAWNAYKSMRVWHFLLDLTQSISSPDEVVRIHHQMFELRIASPQTILSGTEYLESKRLFEQAFRLYDKATSAIPWPAALEVWVVYLTKFVKRFGSRKLERARDLFEEAIRAAPTTKKGGHHFPHPELRLLYIMYADMEENHSLARHSLKVLDRAAKAVQEEDRADMYRLYVVKMATLFGVTKTRPIYEEAMSQLTKPEEVLEFSVRYAEMETRVGEIDRARAVYRHSSQIADPRRRGFFERLWKSWNDFELAHGSEDTYRDMLREKRNVQLNHKGVIWDEDVLLGNDGEGQKQPIRYVKDVEGSEEFNKAATASMAESDENKPQESGDESSAAAETLAKGNGPGDKTKNIEENGIGESGENGDQAVDSECDTREGTSNKDDSKLKIVQKELPESLRRMAGQTLADGSRANEEANGGDEKDEPRPKKPMSAGLQKLMAAARKEADKRKRDEEVETEGEQNGKDESADKDPVEALDRHKKQRR